MKTQDFDFQFPPELVATEASPRGTSRILHIDRRQKSVHELRFEKIHDLFEPGDVLVLNNSHVLWARLDAKKKTGAQLEVFFLKERGPQIWEVLIKGSVKVGTEILLPGDKVAKVEKQLGRTVLIMFDKPVDKITYLKEYGAVPLPPYILSQRKLQGKSKELPSDRSRYQTVWSKEPGSVAAPTASLHFDKHHLDQMKQKGIQVTEITLHVGAGTFLPVDTENLEDFKMHTEFFDLKPEAAALINRAKNEGKRIWACGTTALRALESASPKAGSVEASRGETDIFITPGYEFKVADCLLTNFHQPQSTLLALACAFAGDRDFLLEAYQFAISKRFRLFSYGDLTIIT